MAERCQICKFDIQVNVATSICLKCHKSVCFYCYHKHYNEGNNHIPGFKKHSLHICHLHNFFREIYCQECDEVVCSTCLKRNHQHHKHDNLERIASPLTISKFPAVKNDLEKSGKAVKKLDLKIKKRQKIWESFFKEVVSVDSLLDKQCKLIEGLFFRKKDEVHDIVHGANKEVEIFLKETRYLKVARTIEREKEKTLSELYELAKYKNSKEFFLRHLQFRKDVQNCVTNPQPVGDDVPLLKLNYDQHSISEIEEVLPHIWFG